MRIAYITDSHLGSKGTDFNPQPYWVGGLPTLMERLKAWIGQQQINLVLHGGDLVESGTADEMEQALAQLTQLGRPVAFCLGNHDLARDDSFAQWQAVMDRYPQVTMADAHLPFADCDVYLLNNFWDDGSGPVMFWDPTPPFRHSPTVSERQLEWLDEKLGRRDDRPAIVVIHNQLDPVPPTAPKLEPYIPESYPRRLNEIFDRHPRCRVVLTGHCHVTHIHPYPGRAHLTTSSFGEVPFHVRMIDVREDRIIISTHTMGPPPAGLDTVDERSYVMGTERDHAIEIPFD